MIEPFNLQLLEDTRGYWYLATPYSKYPGGLEVAYSEACKAAAFLIRRSIRVFSPIAHTHPIARFGDLDPLDHNIWLPADKPFMDNACGFIVCKMSGWVQSYGIGEEVKFFGYARKPLMFME